MDEEAVFPSEECSGLSLRDYFAAHALAGWLTAPGDAYCITKESAKSIARSAYLLADAMLEESYR
ncbi:hypothetical protein LDB30_10035 [Acidithiobacillus ferrooxidans]|nr:hypothetical protein LDB30_10035 [Acidithiobacillus ferrooxidans]